MLKFLRPQAHNLSSHNDKRNRRQDINKWQRNFYTRLNTPPLTELTPTAPRCPVRGKRWEKHLAADRGTSMEESASAPGRFTASADARGRHRCRPGTQPPRTYRDFLRPLRRLAREYHLIPDEFRASARPRSGIRTCSNLPS